MTKSANICLLTFVVPFLALLLFFSSCDKTKALKEIEGYIQFRPDSALCALEKIDSTMLKGRNKALYHLLMAMALDKNNVDDGSHLEQAGFAADWFARYGSMNHRMLADYYYADQLMDSGKLDKAVVAFLSSESLAGRLEDWYYCGMSDRCLSDIFRYTYNTEGEVEYIIKALDCFRKAEKTEHSDYAEALLAIAYYNGKNHAAADSLFRVVIDKAHECSNILMESWMLASYGLMYNQFLESESPDSCIARMTHAVALGRKLNSHEFGVLARAYYDAGDRMKSKIYVDSSYCVAGNLQDTLKAKYFDYVINRDDNHEYALRLLSEVNRVNVEVTDVALSQSAVDARRAYYEERVKGIEARYQLSRLIFMLVVSVCILALMILLLIYKSYRKEAALRLERSIRAIEDLRGVLVKVGEFNVKALEFQTFDVLCKEYFDSTEEDRGNRMTYAFENILRHYRDDSEVKAVLEEYVNNKYDGLADFMHGAPDFFSPGDRQIVIYYFSGLSYKAISQITGCKVGALRVRLSRIKHRIEHSSLENKDQVLSYFSR